MCGFISAFTRTLFSPTASRRALDRLAPRGPDGEGEWQDGGAYLGHRRLAILDLDTRAAQPMQSACGRYVIAFNGEIYNFGELRRDLELNGVVFRTTSDTEVILALFASEGEAMLPRLHGMFAFVIWDRLELKAFAARDPYGIKPLYIASISDGILLSSQVKALTATGLVSREPDSHGQAGFWMLGSVPEPYTWYKDIQALQAGHSVWIEDGKSGSQYQWHDIGAAWRNTDRAQVFPDEVRRKVKEALQQSIRRHLVADVPVGVFLSGGIDSGALAGLMVEAGAHDLEGITIAYDEFSGTPEDEAPVAARIAKHYGIRHHIRRVTREEFLTDIPDMLDAMDQPSLDGINTWYASKAVAERGLKVVVSGVGGDELFLGYDSFRQLPRLVAQWRRFSSIPGAMSVASLVAKMQASRSGNQRWTHAPEWAQTIEGAWWLRRSICSPSELPTLMGDEFAAEISLDFDACEWVRSVTGPLPESTELALAQIESMTYMRNQLLRDSDWASMSHSVELRTPLVDAELLQQVREFFPVFNQFPNKVLLAEAPEKPLPKDIIQRKKTGFGIPVKRWLADSKMTQESTRWDYWMQKVVQDYG